MLQATLALHVCLPLPVQSSSLGGQLSSSSQGSPGLVLPQALSLMTGRELLETKAELHSRPDTPTPTLRLAQLQSCPSLSGRKVSKCQPQHSPERLVTLYPRRDTLPTGVHGRRLRF